MNENDLIVRLHPHARERAFERGATKEEIELTILQGEEFPVKFGRLGFRHNFPFDRYWQGRFYRMKQVEVFAVREEEAWLVITVIVKYF